MTEEDLHRLERQFTQAIQDRDMEYLEEKLGENFTLTTGRPGAEVRSRQEWLDITRNRYHIRAFEFDWIHADIYGDYGEAAVVRSRYRQEGMMDQQPRSSTYLMTDVWVRGEARSGKGGWQLVTRHISPLTS